MTLKQVDILPTTQKSRKNPIPVDAHAYFGKNWSGNWRIRLPPPNLYPCCMLPRLQTSYPCHMASPGPKPPTLATWYPAPNPTCSCSSSYWALVHSTLHTLSLGFTYSNRAVRKPWSIITWGLGREGSLVTWYARDSFILHPFTCCLVRVFHSVCVPFRLSVSLFICLCVIYCHSLHQRLLCHHYFARLTVSLRDYRRSSSQTCYNFNGNTSPCFYCNVWVSCDKEGS